MLDIVTRIGCTSLGFSQVYRDNLPWVEVVWLCYVKERNVTVQVLSYMGVIRGRKSLEMPCG